MCIHSAKALCDYLQFSIGNDVLCVLHKLLFSNIFCFVIVWTSTTTAFIRLNNTKSFLTQWNNLDSVHVFCLLLVVATQNMYLISSFLLGLFLITYFSYRENLSVSRKNFQIKAWLLNGFLSVVFFFLTTPPIIVSVMDTLVFNQVEKMVRYIWTTILCM